MLGGDFEIIIWGRAKKGWDYFFMGEVDPSRRHVNILIWQL